MGTQSSEGKEIVGSCLPSLCLHPWGMSFAQWGRGRLGLEWEERYLGMGGCSGQAPGLGQEVEDLLLSAWASWSVES